MSKQLEPIWQFKALHNQKKAVDKQRMGQRFCNMYIKEAWPELFHAPDIDASFLIHDWLTRHQYYDTLPVDQTVPVKVVEEK